MHCVVSSLQQHTILCQIMVIHVPCCVLRTMGINRVQSSTWRLYDNRSATKEMSGSEKHYHATHFVRDLVRDALFSGQGDRVRCLNNLLQCLTESAR